MRKIKFRVWHKVEKRWLDPWAEEDPQLSLKEFGKGSEVFLYERSSGEYSNINCQMKDIVIQQFTGLTDKNGREVYEGDIVRSGSSTSTVEWQEDIDQDFYWGNATGFVFNFDPETMDEKGEYSVIGNICSGMFNDDDEC
jgi:uncharacterized phage protein (TIGR01671 family)